MGKEKVERDSRKLRELKEEKVERQVAVEQTIGGRKGLLNGFAEEMGTDKVPSKKREREAVLQLFISGVLCTPPPKKKAEQGQFSLQENL